MPEKVFTLFTEFASVIDCLRIVSSVIKNTYRYWRQATFAKDGESKSSSSWTDPTQHSQVWAVHLVPIINNTFLYNQWFSTNACMKYFVGRAILPRGQISFGGGGGQEESDCATPLRKPGFVLIIYL